MKNGCGSQSDLEITKREFRRRKRVMSEAEQKELINQVFMQKGTYSGSQLIAGGDRLINKRYCGGIYHRSKGRVD